MVKKFKGSLIGAWAFLIGLVIAVTIGIFSTQMIGSVQEIVLWSLVLLGVIVGLFNVTQKESLGFLFTTLVLVIVSYFGREILMIIPTLGSILGALLVFLVPTLIIVSLKSVFEMAKN
ncbi:MAG: hypothetical protein WCX73_04570 [Candidatus Pacearchaeota archaeon]|jgi:uncharacterized membrane protein YccC